MVLALDCFLYLECAFLTLTVCNQFKRPLEEYVVASTEDIQHYDDVLST